MTNRLLPPRPTPAVGDHRYVAFRGVMAVRPQTHEVRP